MGKIIIFCALWIMCLTDVVFGRDAKIPFIYQGNWSQNVDSCGKDSDQNYFIRSSFIAAWEASWTLTKVLVGNMAIKIFAFHEEYENQFPVKITITKLSNEVINFQECEASLHNKNELRDEYCWSVTLNRCPER